MCQGILVDQKCLISTPGTQSSVQLRGQLLPRLWGSSQQCWFNTLFLGTGTLFLGSDKLDDIRPPVLFYCTFQLKPCARCSACCFRLTDSAISLTLSLWPRYPWLSPHLQIFSYFSFFFSPYILIALFSVLIHHYIDFFFFKGKCWDGKVFVLTCLKILA